MISSFSFGGDIEIGKNRSPFFHKLIFVSFSWNTATFNTGQSRRRIRSTRHFGTTSGEFMLSKVWLNDNSMVSFAFSSTPFVIGKSGTMQAPVDIASAFAFWIWSEVSDNRPFQLFKRVAEHSASPYLRYQTAATPSNLVSLPGTIGQWISGWSSQASGIRLPYRSKNTAGTARKQNRRTRNRRQQYLLQTNVIVLIIATRAKSGLCKLIGLEQDNTITLYLIYNNL